MTTEKNQHDLTRYIPADVKREVRQRCGFGCVVCGSGIYVYDHFSPSFAEAKEHKAEGIILLCGSCSLKKDNKRTLSLETVADCARKPKCLQQGFASEWFDIGPKFNTVVLGNLVVFKPKVILRVLGDDVFSVLPSECPQEPPRINAKMSDRDGNVIFQIIENEWQIPSKLWDIEQVGNAITIRHAKGDIALSVRTEPPSKLVIEQMDMMWHGTPVRLQSKDGLTKITGPLGLLIVVPVKEEFHGRDFVLDASADSLSITGPRYQRWHVISPNSIPASNDTCPCQQGKNYGECCGRW